MSEFKFSCPSCGQHIQADDGYSGRQINCPSCQSTLVVPQNPSAPPPPPVPVPAHGGLTMAARPAATPAAAHAAPPSQQGATGARFQPGAPAAKKSNTKWVVIGSVCGLLVAGGIAWAVYAGVFSHSDSGAADKVGATGKDGKGGASTNVPGLSVAEIVDKTAAQYEAFTSYSAQGTTVMEMDMSKVDAKNIPNMDKMPKNGQATKAMKDALNKPVKIESEVSVKLGRPDLYRVEWKSTVGPVPMMGAVWSAGEGDFMTLAKTKYVKLDNRDEALMKAAGVSGGAAGMLPPIFFNDTSSQLKDLKQAKRGGDESIDGEDCYVLNGEMMGMKVNLWVTKDTFLIKQKQMVLGGKAKTPEMTDAQIDEQLKKLGNLSPAQKAQAKAAMKSAKTMVAQMKGTITETYRSIETNQPLKKADFAYKLPPDAKLSKTLY